MRRWHGNGSEDGNGNSDGSSNYSDNSNNDSGYGLGGNDGGCGLRR
jgi:hypothetical protein